MTTSLIPRSSLTVVVTTGNYKYGQIDTVEAQSIPAGAASASLNWLTKGDHVEFRRGQKYLGTDSVQIGNGKATGLKKATRADGVEVLFGTYAKKLKYYDETTSEWIENGSDLLGSAVIDANGYGLEDISMSEYVGLAGNQLFLNSPNCSGYYKILVANPGSSLNVYSSTYNFKGNIKIDTNRTLLFRTLKDQTGLYGSYIDTQTYTTVTAENTGTGDGSTKHFTHTMGAISSTRTIFGLSISAGSITLTDDYAGNLSASDGSTGTINYVTGALVLDFATAPANLQAITTTYQWEDSNNHGITDFTKSGTRLAGEGFVFRQDEGGGPILSVNTYNQVYFCMHLKKTWQLSLTQDDTSATNLPYREKVGIPNERASVETGNGIYYIDDSDKNDVRARLLTYQVGGSNQVIPVPVSNNINLNDYIFDQACGIEWGDLILFGCALSTSTQVIDGQTVAVNNRVLVYNKLWKSWDILDYCVTCFEIYNGALIGGDSLSNNFIELFSGFDDFDTDPPSPNYWIGNIDKLGLEGEKKCKNFYLQGTIVPDQKIKVSIALNKGKFVEVGGSDDAQGNHTYAIEGNGDYVDKGQSVDIGAVTLGKKTIGGGSDQNAVGYNYERLFKLKLGKFESIQIKFEAVGQGYVSISTQKYWDVRFKGRHVPQKYRG